MTSICIYEDAGWTALRPITDLRPICTVQLGGESIIDRVHRGFPDAQLTLNVRPNLAQFVTELAPKFPINSSPNVLPLVLLNGRVLVTPSVIAQIQHALTLTTDTLITFRGDIVALILKTSVSLGHALLDPTLDSKTAAARLSPSVTAIEIDHCDILSAPWDLGRLLTTAITDTAARFPLGQTNGHVYPNVAMYNAAHIFVGSRSSIEDFVVIDAQAGPVIIDDDVIIESHSRIVGPIYIGCHSQILGGKIRGSSIGPWCKISGEVSSCIFAGYTNKSHDGFWGNSYIGYWSNIGAGSITSNLKNTYGSVSLEYEGRPIDSGQLFLGAIVGDHVKLGIGSHLATGTIVGTASSIFGTAIHDKFVPNLSWGESGAYDITDIDRLLITTHRIQARRGVTMSATEALLLRSIHCDRSAIR